ncbi:hypothetical protein H6H03_06765 [Nostoc paludosum FACHB-159]|uniref:Uncharacterized protein n=1 Tax=Nostoc paludosum FACHB-159 TaxID=2692908 RepID=A0ABR8K3H2_9NOSO|nr:hypothetical protein [Nostoc paludosum FACHB-159]
MGQTESVGGVGEWGRNLSPHTPSSPHLLIPASPRLPVPVSEHQLSPALTDY